jgi:hypothetical protein
MPIVMPFVRITRKQLWHRFFAMLPMKLSTAGGSRLRFDDSQIYQITHLEIKENQRLVISSGQSRDYRILACARALRAFNSIEQIRLFKKQIISENDVPYAQQTMFLFWATNIKLIELVDEGPGTEWWLGTDGALSDA